MMILFLFKWDVAPRDLHSFPTRRSSDLEDGTPADAGSADLPTRAVRGGSGDMLRASGPGAAATCRSEEHTSELQSRGHLVCRLLLEKKKIKILTIPRKTIVQMLR